ncbi:GpE family phage tail protein [Paucibacter sp. KBW04]|nr:GpE family phage tail protein [Paucibacter sp. KBW04]RQO63118.1 GpE family phage tail protein [Paucibacter sp. KBW04]
MADLAYAFHWQPSELAMLQVDELMEWHEQAVRINRELNKAP